VKAEGRRLKGGPADQRPSDILPAVPNSIHVVLLMDNETGEDQGSHGLTPALFALLWSESYSRRTMSSS